MTSDSRFSTTQPAGLGGSGESSRADYALAGAMADQLAEPLKTMQRAIAAFIGSGKLTQLQAQPLGDAIELASRIVEQGRLLAQLANGEVRQTHEQLDLDQLMNRALDEWGHWLRLRGVEAYRNIKPVAVVADAQLLGALVDAALDWSATPGQRLVISLEVKNWPAHAVLRFKSNQTVKSGDRSAPEDETPERLSWHLVSELASAIGATLDRVETADEVLVMLEFPRTVRQLEGLTAMEMDLGDGSWSGNPAKALAGYRVLIITADSGLREDVKLICKGLGLIVDSVPSGQMAERFCELERPELIVVDERCRDAAFDQLRDDLLRIHPNFPFVEISYDTNTLLVSGWMAESMTRVNRNELAGQLPQALAIEMAKVL